MNKKYSVLQYIFGNYEIVHEIPEKDPEAEYILVTDNPQLKSSTWTIVLDNNLIGKDPVFSSWHVRFHLFDYVHTDVCISMDASTIIRKSLRPFYDKFQAENYDVALMPHPCRFTMDKEYGAWVVGRKYPEQQAITCIQFMQSIGYDPCNHKGLYQGNFRISRNNKENDDYMRLTFDFCRLLSAEREGVERVDQNIASVVMNKWFTHMKVMALSEQVVRSEALTWCYHGSERPKLDAYSPDGHSWNLEGKYDLSVPDIKWVFNKEVQCFYWKDGDLFMPKQ